MFRITKIRTFDKPDYETLSGNYNSYLGDNKISISKESRYKSVMKVLKPKQVYSLVSSDTPDGFFNNDQLPDINISAIVGENGMGKSSLVDLMVRIINNTVYTLRHGLNKDEKYHLRFVRDIFASISFETSDGKYTIEQMDTKLSFKKEGSDGCIWTFDFLNRDNDSYGFLFPERSSPEKSSIVLSEYCREWLSMLFYTIEINYSAYANNILDLQQEYTDNSELENHEKINPYAVDVDSRIWMSSIFHKNDSYQLPLVLTPFRSLGKINYNNEQDLTRDRLCHLALMEPSPLDGVLLGKRPDYILFDVNPLFSCPSIPSNDGVCIVSQGLQRECEWLRSNTESKNESFDSEEAYFSDNLEYNKAINDFGCYIIDSWSDILKIDLKEQGKELNRRSAGDGSHALSYLVYKTIKIARTYVKFKATARMLRKLFESYDNQSRYLESVFLHNSSDLGKEEIPNKEIKVYLHTLLNDTSHVTLKLRRTLALLIFKHYTTKKKKISLVNFNKTASEINKNPSMEISKVRGEYSITDENDFPVEHQWNFEELMPSPAIRSDVIFVTNVNNELKNSHLSSGERQMLAVLSAAIYHLYNVSTWVNENARDEGKLSYPYVSIIFDEVELYFHPKYQTQFIKALLTAIKGLNVKDTIKGINLIFATHSPFLLSDIPSGNILCLDNGLPSKQLKRTFCANVYDILATGFFMKKFVGDFAYEKVRSIVESLDGQFLSWEEMQILKKEIEMIGDDFIRESLLERYESKISHRQ